MDLMGPLSQSIQRSQYVLVVVDDFSRYVWVRFMRTKDEVEEVLQGSLFPTLERQFDRQIRGVRSDRGGEFLSTTFS